MKNKTKTYLLLIAVLGIWGVIGYKIINGLSPEDSVIATEDFNVSFSPKKIDKNEVFAISDVKRDPFLGTLMSKQKSKKNRVTTVNKSPEIPQPNIAYLGLVKEQNSRNQIFVLTINGSQYLLKQGQETDNVKLVRGNSKQIVVRFNKKNKTILIQ